MPDSNNELEVPVALWQLQDLETTIADASPEELPKLHSKLLALSSGLSEALETLIKLREQTAISEYKAELREKAIDDGEVFQLLPNQQGRFKRKVYIPVEALEQGENDKGMFELQVETTEEEFEQWDFPTLDPNVKAGQPKDTKESEGK